jgi:hypothetical protein
MGEVIFNARLKLNVARVCANPNKLQWHFSSIMKDEHCAFWISEYDWDPARFAFVWLNVVREKLSITLCVKAENAPGMNREEEPFQNLWIDLVL